MSNGDEISCLPEEVLAEIFSYLSVRDLVNVSYVCRHWKNVQSDPYVWKNSKFICDNTLSYNDIVQVLDNASLLEIIYFDRTRDVQAVVDKVSSTCFNIHTLIIKNMKEFCPRYFVKLAQSCCRIKILELPSTLRGCESMPVSASTISVFSNLRRLGMKCCRLEKGALKLIVDGCPYLEELYIPQADVIESDIAYLIEQKKQTLRALFIDGVSLTEVTLGKLGELHFLRALTVAECKHPVRITENIRNLNLVSLGFPFGSKLTSDVMSSLLSVENMRNLKLINVAGCYLLDDSFARSMAMCCPSIEHLNLFCCTGLTEYGIDFIIKKCSKLKTLNMTRLPYTVEDTLDLIPKHLKSLKVLYLDGILEDQRGSKVRKFLETVPILMPQLQVLLGVQSTASFFPEDNSDMYHLWSKL